MHVIYFQNDYGVPYFQFSPYNISIVCEVMFEGMVIIIEWKSFQARLRVRVTMWYIYSLYAVCQEMNHLEFEPLADIVNLLWSNFVCSAFQPSVWIWDQLLAIACVWKRLSCLLDSQGVSESFYCSEVSVTKLMERVSCQIHATQTRLTRDRDSFVYDGRTCWRNFINLSSHPYIPLHPPIRLPVWGVWWLRV